MNNGNHFKVARWNREWYVFTTKVSEGDISFQGTNDVMITRLSDGHWVTFQNLEPSSTARLEASG